MLHLVLAADVAGRGGEAVVAGEDEGEQGVVEVGRRARGS